MPPQMDKMMQSMGKFYEAICKIPVAGESIARFWNRSMGKMLFHSPGSAAKRQKNIQGIKENLEEMIKLYGFPIEVIPETVGPDSFEIYVNYCPYGFKEAHQEIPCDAAMDMDRELFRQMGAELTVLESAPKGAEKCRCIIKWIE